MKNVEIQRNAYYDSVTLMLVTRDIKSIIGIESATICMGTEHNKQLLNTIGLLTEECKSCSPNDLIIALDGTSQAIDEAQKLIKSGFDKKKQLSKSEYKYNSLKKAIEYNDKANLVLISVAGEFAEHEAQIALKAGKHVMLFSDNMNIEQEIRLKNIAKERQLLMMGPDCGTAIINGRSFGFANKIHSGNVGIVGASGTGIQEVTTLIDKLGCGITQAIGTGGRDLTKEIGGITMEMGIDALAADPKTKVIVLISKPPHPDVAKKIISKAKEVDKPFVINFLGEMKEKSDNVEYASTFDQTAMKACHMVSEEGGMKSDFYGIPDILDTEFTPQQKYLRALYTGGTLCYEVMLLADGEISEMYSNIPIKSVFKLDDSYISKGNAFIDLGDDIFTRGKPHPIIEPEVRNNRIVQESKDPEVAVILMDFILGYGAHKDPVGSCLPYILEAKKNNPNLCFVASVTGTKQDPQDLDRQTELLIDNGVILASCNAQAAQLAISIVKEITR